ncbi:uncharacterized protein [Panulirus ornatus]|uniref:uncharacterized protein n=1 Tax=Panulirus ornatus TaxID=150431 RepID=UPI003A86CD6C
MRVLCLLAVMALCASASLADSDAGLSSHKQTKPVPRPQIQPPRPYGGVQTLPARLPEDFRRPAGGQTRPSYRPDVPSFQRPQIQPAHPSAGVQTLPARLPEDFRRPAGGQTRPSYRPDIPSFQRPQIQPAHPSAGVQTLPARLPEDFRRPAGGQTRPSYRPDIPSFQRPQIQPPHPSFLKENISGKQTKPAPKSFIPQEEADICSDCGHLSFVRKGACCRRWDLCC